MYKLSYLMIRELYITENPFRIVGAGSGITQSELRRESDATARRANVGLFDPVPLESEFGSADVDGFASSVRALATDPVLRTVYRLMWPIDKASIADLLTSNTTSLRALPTEELNQNNFLNSWLGLLQDKSSSSVSRCLENWIEFYNDTLMDNRLKALIVLEDGLNDADAYECVLVAQDQVERHLLNRIASIAAQKWQAGKSKSATRMIGALLHSRLDENVQEQALDPMIEIGEDLAKTVEQISAGMPPFTLGSSTDPPRQVVQLERLTSILAARHPIAGGWEDVVADWHTTLGWNMRAVALELNKNNDDVGALSVVNTALNVVRNDEIRNRLLEDRTRLEEIISDKERNKPYAEIRPISSAPGLSTINGIGTTLYGSAPFPPDQRYRYSVLYFVFVFVPLFPLARYVVEPSGHNSWKFLGTTRWTHAMKAHLTITCTAVVIAAISMWHSSEPTASMWTTEATSSAAAPTAWSPANTVQATNSSTPAKPIVNQSTKQAQAGKEPRRANTPTPPSWVTTPVKALSPPKLGEQTWQDAQRQKLKEELAVLKTLLDSANSSLETEDRELKAQSATLHASKAEIDSATPNSENQQEIDDYNAKVRAYEAQRTDYNASVELYNEKLASTRELIKRHNEIVEELNKDLRQ